MAIMNIDEMDKQSIRIYLDNTPDIRFVSPIPNNFKLNVKGEYRDFMSGDVGGSINSMLNALGLSAAFKWSKVEIWKSQNPFEIEIPIKIVAIQDSFFEIYRNLLRLISMASPHLYTQGSFLASSGILIPPGPDILAETSEGITQLNQTITDLATTITKADPEAPAAEALKRTLDNINIFEFAKSIRNKVFGKTGFGSTITVEIGKFLKFDKMVITSINATIGDSSASIMPMNMQGYPIQLNVQLKLRGTKMFTENYVKSNDLYSSERQKEMALANMGLIDDTSLVANAQRRQNRSRNNSLTGSIASIYKKFIK